MLGNLKINKTIGILCALLIVLIFIAIFAYFYLNKHSEATPNPTEKSAAIQPSINDEELAKIAQETTADKQSSEPEGLIDDSILTQPIAKDPALVKDELKQLEDIQNQLKEQKDILEQQHHDADQLIQLKEQQLADLEKQLHSQ